MATEFKNLSDYDSSLIPNLKGHKFGIVTSEWNPEITHALLKGAYETFIAHGVLNTDIIQLTVPGSFELSIGAQRLCQNPEISAVIALGCVIQGETKHFDFICQAVANGLTDLNLKYDKPVIMGVLTTNNWEQAKDRSGGKHGNKGVEAAVTAMRLCLNLQRLKW